MKQGIKLELYRAFHNAGFPIAVFLGSIITVFQFVFRVLPEMNNIVDTNSNLSYPLSVFNTCLMLDLGGFYSYLYYNAIILIAVIPFGVSYYTDLREGYIKNVYTRMDRKGYLIGKYIAVFVSAGFVCVIPLILNLLLTSMVMPSLLPQAATGRFSIGGFAMLKEVFYTHPWIYIGIYLLIDFVMTGLFGCMTLVVTKFVYNRYIVLFVPFLLFILVQTVAQFSYYNAAGPYFIIDASQTIWENLPTVIIEIVFLFLFTFITFYLMGGRKRDAL